MLMGTAAAVCADHGALSLPFGGGDDSWTFAGSELHEGWVDRRALFVLYHPWAASLQGGAGEVSRQVRVPQGWGSGRVQLHFYMSDDYDGQAGPLEASNWLSQERLVGHRFKQVLVDGEVVWERDVADAADVEADTRFRVLLPARIGAGATLRLAFRLVDRVGSAQRLPGDHRSVGSTGGIDAEGEWKFMTHVFVGDVMLAPEGAEPACSGEAPSARVARVRHDQAWPLPPAGTGAEVDFPLALQLEGGAALATAGGVIHAGIPLPLGRVHSPEEVVLRRSTGAPLPVQLTPMNRWPDGSLRWVEVDMLMPAGPVEPRVLLDIGGGGAPVADRPVTLAAGAGGAWCLSTGVLEVTTAGGGDVLVNRLTGGGARLEDLRGEVQLGGQTYRTLVLESRALATGPVRAEIELNGFMEGAAGRIGRFVFRLAAFAGQPCVRMTWRIFNERAATIDVERFELVGDVRSLTDAAFHWRQDGPSSTGAVDLRQPEADRFVVLDASGAPVDSGAAAPGWLAARTAGQTLLVLVRHFREQFPKGIRVAGDQWRIRLFEPTAAMPHYQPTAGEAKRHELWLGLWDRRLGDAEVASCAALCARPPRLFDAGYFSASGGFGAAAASTEPAFAGYQRLAQTQYGAIEAERFYVNGIRHWGDQPYGDPENGLWRNGYYDVQQGLASAYLMSGEPRWFDRLEAVVRHIMDVDVCHASAAHPDWVGAMHGYSEPNHTTAPPWPPTQRTKGTLAYWRLTGDRDARAAALAVAESAVRSGRALGAQSVRDHAGVLYCLTAAFDETGEARYQEAARKVAHDALRRIDARRGAYLEVHGSVSYRGNVPWMVAQLAEPMFDYYRQSGDVEAAVAVVQLMESVLTENTTPGVWGDVHGYSHNPQYGPTSSYHALIAPAVFYAYELTGDAFFLRHGRAMFAMMMEREQIETVMNCAWNTPTLLYYLKRYGVE